MQCSIHCTVSQRAHDSSGDINHLGTLRLDEVLLRDVTALCYVIVWRTLLKGSDEDVTHLRGLADREDMLWQCVLISNKQHYGSIYSDDNKPADYIE